ncbi:GyrI-like domain-containing protein [Psychrobacillus vulpis]|uniref:AraC family transcriptional regulator n=1 Tax=Psychrobacillus vulpis TaxID=2325572 RepID=A0A544TRA9_9BACI|nr:GyrI-like domain-containing protein [Psychrobacillus vulpis]TQR19996.1 AraC family transcriptional regulator [Psychrobacillus vulpis]
MQFRIVDRDAFQVIGINREFPYDVEDGGIQEYQKFWNEIHENGTVNQLDHLKDGETKGLLGIWAEVNKEKNIMDYYVAAEYSGETPIGLKKIEFAASKWVVFEVLGPFPSAMANAWGKIYSEWFPSSGYEPAEMKPFEVYIDTNTQNPNAYNEIWIPIK